MELRGKASLKIGTDGDSSANESGLADHPLTTRQEVYFIQSGLAGPIKIGVAANVRERLAAHQTSNHETLHVLVTTPGSAQLEREYHKRFRAHRLRGEWFHPAPEICLEIDRLREARGDFLLSAMEEWELEFWARSPDPEQAAPYVRSLERQRGVRQARGREVVKYEVARTVSASRGKTSNPVLNALSTPHAGRLA